MVKPAACRRPQVGHAHRELRVLCNLHHPGDRSHPFHAHPGVEWNIGIGSALC